MALLRMQALLHNCRTVRSRAPLALPLGSRARPLAMSSTPTDLQQHGQELATATKAKAKTKLATTPVNISSTAISDSLTPTISRLLSPASSCAYLNKPDALSLVGWLKSVRTQKQHTFLHLQDGTHPEGIQIVLAGDHSALPEGLSTGTALRITNGTLQPSPPGFKQLYEVHISPSTPIADSVTVIASSDPTYPLQKKRHSLDFLRTITHLRPRSNLISAVQRTRHASQLAMHQWFNDRDFMHIHTPILTASDCEGAGETFTVTGPASKPGEPAFFGGPAEGGKHAVHLTVSGQLHLEMFAAAHPRVYTLSPAFRAEKSLSSRHLAEFYMLEAEMAFIDRLDPLLDVTGKLVQACAKAVNVQDVVQVAEILAMQAGEKGDAKKERVQVAEHRIQQLADGKLERVTYTEAVKYLQGHKRAKKFTFPVVWGNDLQAEHESVLADEVGGPVFVTDYPTPLKPFYMLPNEHDDRKTTACFDMLVPGVGELVGGSLREHDPIKLAEVMRARGMDPASDDYKWYVELRKYGMGPHGGFGMGFDRLVRYLLGVDSVREVVPVPRYYTECRY